jgi:NADPH:quinone reductase
LTKNLRTGLLAKPKKRRGIEVIPYGGTAGVREFEHLGRAVETSKPKIPIASEYRLADAAKAHARLARGHVLGKSCYKSLEGAQSSGR